MQLMTVVEEYVHAAMRQAGIERSEDGILIAWVPGIEGVIATGRDQHECAEDLYRRLEDWVKVGLARGYDLPVIDGINLNTDATRTLSTYHPDRIESGRGETDEYFPDETRFMNALADRGRKR